MTLTIIFGIALLAGTGLLVWGFLDDNRYSDWKEAVGGVTIAIMTLCIITNLCLWIPSIKNSEITYNQLLAEKNAIEAMLETDKDVDRFLLNSAVIEYNNRIIRIKVNSGRLIFKDYYNQNLDWGGLELINWNNKER